MCDDSRNIMPGDTFISLNGNEEYIKEAISKGASKIICREGSYEVPTINVDNPHEYLANYLDELYKDTLNKIKIIGITGTNGKTTSAYLLHQIMNKLGLKCGYIGTIGFYIHEKIDDLNNTTPEVLKLYQMILKCIDEGCKYVVMEVSSQALSYNRTGNILFDYGIFTNLTEDHLDYHKTMDNYALAKQILFKHIKGKAIINADSQYKDYFILDNNINITYGKEGDYKVSNIDINNHTFKVNDKLYETNLIGRYNIYNLLTSIIVLDLENIEYDIDILNNLDYPKGRMETIKYNDNLIIIDYAHTPDAMENIIKTVKELKHNNIITIIGAGGDRDPFKRSIMGVIATKYSDYTIFTEDNPRTENPLKIMSDIVKEVDTFNYEIITNRKNAIIKGIQMLKKNDILLVLGKGHEEYQIIGNKKIPFSDTKVVLEYIQE